MAVESVAPTVAEAPPPVAPALAALDMNEIEDAAAAPTAPPPAGVAPPPGTTGLALALPRPPMPAPDSAPYSAPPTPDDAADLPAWRRYALPAPAALGRPTISVVIDDMGVNLVQTARAVALPGPLTLSWLPYAPHLAEQVAAGAAHGHETMLHLPVEALGRMDPGPETLRTWLPPATNLGYLKSALDKVPTAVALNQHEGSVGSLSVPLMDLVMGELRARRMAFLDSLTIPRSVALSRARAAGLPAVGRDLFIDNDPNPAAIRARLAEVEAIARQRGHAILIGHPRATTMDVLGQYLPGLATHGFVLWPLSATIVAETQMQVGSGPADGVVAPANLSGAE